MYVCTYDYRGRNEFTTANQVTILSLSRLSADSTPVYTGGVPKSRKKGRFRVEISRFKQGFGLY